MPRLSASERREQIYQCLQETLEPVPARDLADRFAVSRQVIVQDIAVLRAAGNAILATATGYIIPRHVQVRPYHQVLAVRHRPEQTETELYAFVDAGVRLVDVIVDHPVYGELRGALMLETRTDVARFLSQVRGVNLLSSLTGGLHLHTIEAEHPDQLRRARAALEQLGFLVTEQSKDPNEP